MPGGRWLSTGKIFLVSPLATVLCFGSLGWMLWNLREACRFGDSAFGEAMEGLTGSVRDRTSESAFTLVEFHAHESEFIADVHGVEGSWRFPILICDLPPPNAPPPFPVASIQEEVLRCSGLFALTEREIRLSVSGRIAEPGTELGYTEIDWLLPEAREAMDRVPELAGVTRRVDDGVERYTAQIWSGHAYNAAMLGFLVVGVRSLRWVTRGVRLQELRGVWAADGVCKGCGYVLEGLGEARCPECGGERALQVDAKL